MPKARLVSCPFRLKIDFLVARPKDAGSFSVAGKDSE